MTEETQEKQALDTSLVGKPIEELTPAELAQLQSQLAALTGEIDARQKAVRDEATAEVFAEIARVSEEGVKKLAWAKLPKMTLVPDTAGEHYTVAYAAKKVKGGGGGRAVSEVNSGAITINKIGIAMGGIAWFKDKDGKEHEGIKELVKALKNPETGESEGDRCWDIVKKGVSASDIVIKYHAEEVTLVFNDGTELLVKDAVEKMKEARAGVATS
ncbi:hypothetical protein ES703_99337 [subsurface metagenome]